MRRKPIATGVAVKETDRIEILLSVTERRVVSE